LVRVSVALKLRAEVQIFNDMPVLPACGLSKKDSQVANFNECDVYIYRYVYNMYNYVNMIKDNGLFIELKHASQEQTHQKLSSVEALFLKCEPGIWVARRQDAPGVV
jgi:hypothetical protein